MHKSWLFLRDSFSRLGLVLLVDVEALFRKLLSCRCR